MAQTIDNLSSPSSVGRSVRRVDGREKLTGYTRYAGDRFVAGLLHARPVLSPYAHAHIMKIDSSAALAVPGVKFVYTAQTLGIVDYDLASRTRSPLAREEVLWSGQPVALVLAESEAAAEDGAALVEVEYEMLPAVTDIQAAMRPGSPLTRVVQTALTSEIAGGGAHATVDKGTETVRDSSKKYSEILHRHIFQLNLRPLKPASLPTNPTGRELGLRPS